MSKAPKIKVFQYDLPDGEFLGHIDELSIDTETLGLDCFRDRLCTIQMMVNSSTVYIIHFPEPIYTAKNLKKVLSNNAIPKLFHYARFDVHIIFRNLNILLDNIVCTRSLSKIVRTYSDKHGLKHVCKELLDINLNKGEQSSNWGNDKLTQDQINYAANDVIYLPKLYDILKTMAEKENKYVIAECFFKILPSIVFLDDSKFNPVALIEHH